MISLAGNLFRAFSAGDRYLIPPGPMAQAVTLRAFGAPALSFHTLSKASGCQA